MAERIFVELYGEEASCGSWIIYTDAPLETISDCFVKIINEIEDSELSEAIGVLFSEIKKSNYLKVVLNSDDFETNAEYEDAALKFSCSEAYSLSELYDDWLKRQCANQPSDEKADADEELRIFELKIPASVENNCVEEKKQMFRYFWRDHVKCEDVAGVVVAKGMEMAKQALERTYRHIPVSEFKVSLLEESKYGCYEIYYG